MLHTWKGGSTRPRLRIQGSGISTCWAAKLPLRFHPAGYDVDAKALQSIPTDTSTAGYLLSEALPKSDSGLNVKEALPDYCHPSVTVSSAAIGRYRSVNVLESCRAKREELRTPEIVIISLLGCLLACDLS